MNDIECFKFNINEISRTEIDAAYFLMSEERREKCDRYKADKERLICIAADMQVRRLLSERTGIPAEELIFEYGEKGKPYLVNGRYFFNISHSGGYIAVVLSKNNEVGIDIEKIKPVKLRLLSHFCTEQDMAFIVGESKDAFCSDVIENFEILSRIFRVWTYKEAYVKSIGESIAERAKEFSFDEKNCIESHFSCYRQCIVVNK